MYADLIFDVALTQDPENKRAQFYKAFLAPMMSFKGFYTRIQPAVLKYGTEEDVEQYQNTLNSFPISSLRTFLTDSSGITDISDEASLQVFLDEFRRGQKEFRIFLANNKDMNLTLNVNVLAAGAMLEQVAKDCDASLQGTVIETPETCNTLEALQITLDRGDIETLQHIQAGLETYLILATAYDATGLVELSRINEETKLTEQEIVKFLKDTNAAGKLRASNGLSDVVEMGSDFVAGLKWANKMQHQLCPQGVSSTENRKKNLFKRDFCASSVSQERPLTDVIAELDRVLRGGKVTLSYREYEYDGVTEVERTYSTEVAPIAVFQSPIENILDLAPQQFDDCGQITNFADNTLGGLYPNGDANFHVLGERSCGTVR